MYNLLFHPVNLVYPVLKTMKLESWKNSGEFFDYQGNSIFYRQSKPSEEVTLLLHGFPTASFDWHKIWDKLAEHFPLLAYDYIGYGFSAKPVSFDYTTFNQVDLLQSLIAELNVKKVHILAHDYGNTITQELLARENEGKLNFKVASVCLLNGALFPETHRPILVQKILISPFGFLFAKLLNEKRFKRGLASVFGKQTQPSVAELNDFAALFSHNQGKRIAHKLIRYMAERKVHRERWVSALQSIKVPFRFINGLDDPVSGKHLVERFREVVPQQTDIIELPNIGHYPQVEAAEKVLESYLEFREKFSF